MKRIYRRTAWLVDDGILLEGFVTKRKFYPKRCIQCGFGCQIIRKRDIGKIIFFNKADALKTGMEIITETHFED